MKIHLFLLCPVLFFAGCPQPSQAPQVTPTPAVVSVPVATSTVALPSVATTSAKNIHADEEFAWLDAANKAIKIVTENQLDKVSSLDSITELRANIVQAVANYNQVPVPVKYTKADFYLQKGFTENQVGLDLLETGFRTGDQELAKSGRPHYVDGGKWVSKAIDEISLAYKKN